MADQIIVESNRLAEISGLIASFQRTNILDIDDSYNDSFDFIYISEGSLQWFPDLNEYFAVVARLLKEGGSLLIYEMHPFSYFFEKGFDLESPDLTKLVSYFDESPHNYESGLDYIGSVEYESQECFWYVHKLSDILKALRENEIFIIDFDEYNFEMANNANTQYLDMFPLSYILVGKKSQNK